MTEKVHLKNFRAYEQGVIWSKKEFIDFSLVRMFVPILYAADIGHLTLSKAKGPPLQRLTTMANLVAKN